MNPRSTGILAIVAAVLGSFVYFYEFRGQVDREAADAEDRRIFAELDAESVDWVALESQDGISARFRRSEGAWELVEPVEAPADGAALDAMTSVLSQLERAGRVDAPGSLSEYGLGEDARTIRFEVDGQARGLRIGRETPIGGHLYVATLSSDDVAYVEKFRLNAFNRNLSDLRDRRVMSFEPADVTKISLAWPGGAVELEKQDARWRVISPVEELADEPTVRDLLTDLSFMNARGFVDEEDETIAEAMTRAELDVRLIVGTSEVEQRLIVGSPIDGSPVVRGRGGRLFEIAPERLEDIERSVPAYRFRTLSEFDSTQARKLALDFATVEDATTTASPSVEARLVDGRWRGDEPEIESDRFDSLLQTLSLLKAETIVADEMGSDERASLGLSPPRSRLRVEAEDEQPLADVFLGRLDDARGIYAQRAGDPKVYVLDPALAESLPISRDVFEARFVAGGDGETDSEASDASEAAFEDEDPLSGLEIP